MELTKVIEENPTISKDKKYKITNFGYLHGNGFDPYMFMTALGTPAL